MTEYEEKVSELIEYLEKIDVEMKAIDTCQYDGAVISQILSAIQKIVDQFVMNNYSNLNTWIENLNKTVKQTIENSK